MQLQTDLPRRRDDHAVVRSRAGDFRVVEAQFGAPAGSLEAEEWNRSVHWIFFFTLVHGRVVREILEGERYADLTGAQTCLFDERCALCGALRGSRLPEWLIFGHHIRVGGDGLAQVGPHSRMLTRIKA
jgi:hypothetical protein